MSLGKVTEAKRNWLRSKKQNKNKINYNTLRGNKLVNTKLLKEKGFEAYITNHWLERMQRVDLRPVRRRNQTSSHLTKKCHHRQRQAKEFIKG